MVTHDPVAASYADQVVFLVDGRVAGRMTQPTADAVADQMAHLDELTPWSRTERPDDAIASHPVPPDDVRGRRSSRCSSAPSLVGSFATLSATAFRTGVSSATRRRW